MTKEERKFFVWTIIIIVFLELIIIISSRDNYNFYPSIIAFTIIDFILFILVFLHVRNYLSTHNVSWITPKYSIVPYHDNFKYNFNGKVISYDEHYIICRKIPFFFSTMYVDCDSTNWVSFHDNEFYATHFETKIDARKKLKDILTNPNKYRMSY